jgi:hypothetical protein
MEGSQNCNLALSDDSLQLLWHLKSQGAQTFKEMKAIEEYDALEAVKSLVAEKLVYYHPHDTMFLITTKGYGLLRDRGLLKYRPIRGVRMKP